MASNIRRVTSIVLVLFLIVALDLAYWQIIEGPALASNGEYNATRLLIEEANTRRGRILDRAGQPLARSEPRGQTESGVVAGYRRVYTTSTLATTVGYHDPRYGNAGLESAYDSYLSGETGVSLATKFRNKLVHTPIVGSDVMTTIDSSLQAVVDQALGDGPGAAVVMDPKTGAILAIASHPYFDPNNLARDWEQLRDAPGQPLFNRATQGLYSPGSVFKTVTLSATLELNQYKPDTKFTCDNQILVEGFPIKCEEYHKGTFDLGYAYAFSCNPCFAQIGMRLGGKDLVDFARRFGFESRIPLELPTSPSQIASSDPTNRLVGPLLASTAFGQGEILTTPLQMALVAATVANNGVAPTPYLVSEVRGENGSVIARTTPKVWRNVVSPQTAKTVVEMMVEGVDTGLASAAKIPGVKVGGKTGTAEVGGDQKTHAWFIGVAPADSPKYVVAVVKEHGGGGGTVATPIGRLILEAALKKP